MRVLAITNMYPSPAWPVSGVFVEEQVRGLQAVGVDVDVLFIDRRTEGAMTYYRMAPRIREAVAKFKPDLIHVMYGGVMADQITAQDGLPPTIVTFRGSDLLGENLSGLLRKVVSHYGVHCSRKAARRAAGIVVVARHMIRVLPRSVDQRRLRVIHSGINLDRFRPMEQASCQRNLGWDSSRFHVLFATSSNDPVKRPWLARAAVKQLAAGGVPAELQILSGVPTANVPQWINASDALLLTSLHEGSPTIVKEALACGLPIVSVDVGDVVEGLEGINGCHIAEAEPEDLAAKLRLVYERRERLGVTPKLEDLSHTAVARKLQQFYEEILSFGLTTTRGRRGRHS